MASFTSRTSVMPSMMRLRTSCVRSKISTVTIAICSSLHLRLCEDAQEIPAKNVVDVLLAVTALLEAADHVYDLRVIVKVFDEPFRGPPVVGHILVYA